jgi:hypothetical protein
MRDAPYEELYVKFQPAGGMRRNLPYLSARSKESSFGIVTAPRGDNNAYRQPSILANMHAWGSAATTEVPLEIVSS